MQPSKEVTTFISREAAIDALGERPLVWDEWADEYSLGQRNQYDADKSAIEALPSAPPERKKGKWIDGKCDQCGEHAPYWAMASTYHLSNFCPNCGADMRERREDAETH